MSEDTGPQKPSWQQFIEDGELNVWTQTSLAFINRSPPGASPLSSGYQSTERSPRKFEQRVPPVSLWCKECQATIKHSYDVTPIYVKEGELYSLLIEYSCPACDSVHFVPIHARYSNNRIEVMKFGQDPPKSIDLPPSFELLADSTELEWLRKGRRCEEKHWGIGAYAYYRLVVESTRIKLFKLLRELYTDPEHIEHIDEAISTKSFDDSFKLVSDIIPPCFSVGNTVNPLKSLYELTSDGLHFDSADDTEILKDAEAVREALVMLLKAVENERDLKAQGKLTAHKIDEAIARKRARTAVRASKDGTSPGPAKEGA